VLPIPPVFAAVAPILAPIANVFAQVAAIFTAIADVLEPIPASAVVLRVANVLASIADVFLPVANVLAPVKAIFPAVPDVFQPIPAVVRPWPLRGKGSRGWQQREDQGSDDDLAQSPHIRLRLRRCLSDGVGGQSVAWTPFW
jgi:hypothetical protein